MIMQWLFVPALGSADPAAIQLAMDNLNACDPFLRAAAISYLDILHDEGLFP